MDTIERLERLLAEASAEWFKDPSGMFIADARFALIGGMNNTFAPLLRVAKAARAYVDDDDEDRTETFDEIVAALAALDAVPT